MSNQNAGIMTLSTPWSSSNRKIDPTRRRPDGSPDDNDRVEIGPTAKAFAEFAALGVEAPNLDAMRADRLARLRAQMVRRDVGGLLLFDPLNIRYATDSTNMQLWTTHNLTRACFVAAEGPVVLWDFHGCEHLTDHLPLITERRHGASFFYFETGERTDAAADGFAAEVDSLMRAHGGGNRRLGIDKIEIAGLRAFDKRGITVCSGQQITELARVVKGPDEIKAMRCSMAACEAAVAEMRSALRPGMAENELWAHLHHGNIARGGEWIETRILCSGPRTNPWFQECGPRIIEAGDLLAFDTDLVGVYGYCSDISRTWLTGDHPPTNEQKRLHGVAYEHIMTNAALLKPGAHYRDLTYGGHQLPAEFVARRYGVRFHGIGLCDEFPSIRYAQDFFDEDHDEEDSILKPGMAFCVEAYIGAEDGREGVKLEDQWIVTENGAENLTKCPFDPALMGTPG
jgi:Xaa-Pro aminopeptidase